MKRKVNNIFIVLIASLVFFVGAGVTIVNLCCGNCISKILSPKEHVSHCPSMADLTSHEKMKNCCSKDAAKTTTDKSCEDKHADEECGTSERVSVDLSDTTFKPSIAPLVWCVITLHTDLLNYITEPHLNIGVDNDRRAPIPIPPRDYLSLIRVLII